MNEPQIALTTAGRSRRLWAITRTLLTIGLATGAVALVTIPASAENPLYCNGEYTINNGCNGPEGNLHQNEGRNENGGCIAVQDYDKGSYSGVIEACGGNVASIEELIEGSGFPRCWNRSSKALIHCRYSFF